MIGSGLVDGVQLQWLLDPEVDMAGVVESLLSALHGLGAASGDVQGEENA